jgi:hypothetical protein
LARYLTFLSLNFTTSDSAAILPLLTSIRYWSQGSRSRPRSEQSCMHNYLDTMFGAVVSK